MAKDEKRHWDRLAGTYNNEIFDVFNNDCNEVLTQYFDRYANKAHTAVDFGCGNGKAFPYLVPRFGEVWGLDISQNLLDVAALRGYHQVRLAQEDLVSPSRKLPRGEFAFCCNVAILPAVEPNAAMIRNIRRSLKPGGTAVFVIPSFESAAFSMWRLVEWYKREGTQPSEIDRDELALFGGPKADIVQGLLRIDGVTTKHYSEPEIRYLFALAGFKSVHTDRIEYTWNSEFDAPPKWMKDPYPWDWLVECRV
jgi:SAM-dependent methyltransferase